MPLKCARCGYDNNDDALVCNLCTELLSKKPTPAVFIRRGEARFGRHAPLPAGLAAKLAGIADAKGRLRVVFLFTMSVNGAEPKSAFGFGGDAHDAMREANEFLREADPHMPADVISADLQCLPLSRQDYDEFRRISIVLLDR
ncbi:MAG: hypothetical protein SF051_12455 [Elusimicrobiota bacterium]|nr:hypothetical protein [Elusimicrobiota bacterium]